MSSIRKWVHRWFGGVASDEKCSEGEQAFKEWIDASLVGGWEPKAFDQAVFVMEMCEALGFSYRGERALVKRIGQWKNYREYRQMALLWSRYLSRVGYFEPADGSTPTGDPHPMYALRSRPEGE